MIDLQVSNYTSNYDYLNGYKTQNIKPLDLARAMITVGKGNWTDVFHLGIFRIGELICKALAFSKIERGNLVLQDRFFNLNRSEKATISYYFGQGLTKLYAEEFLNLNWLFHVDDYIDYIEFNAGSAPSKVIIKIIERTAERPDLIGIKQGNVSHIFEAKGNSNGYNKNVMQHAINQVSQIRTYNNIVPETRTACYFDLSKTPIRGIIIDPENENSGVDIKFKEELAITKYYSFFRENRKYFLDNYEYHDYEFMITPVGVPNMFFGYDKRLLDLKPEEILSKGLYKSNNEFLKNEDTRINEISIGLDGLILINYKDINSY